MPTASPAPEPPNTGAPILSLDLPDEAATVALGRLIAGELSPGDLVALWGDLGSGKTTLARAVLRAHLGQPDMEAPSPTFTLVQSYDGPLAPVLHADFYRIGGEGELVELGLDDATAESITLVEWPDRAPELMNRPRLDVLLTLDEDGATRRAIVSGLGGLADRIRRTDAIVRLIERTGWGDATRGPMQGDASSRAYERLVRPGGETAVLMISPPRPDGPPVRRGKPYSAIARLAESIHAFVALDGGLRGAGISAPALLGQDLENGLLILEDLGSDPVVDADGPIPERYGEATRLLAALHGVELTTTLPVGEAGEYTLPPYDLDAMMIEVELLLDWYLPHMVGTEPSGSVRAEFGHVWRETLAEIIYAPTTWTLRDYHSPNLIWLPDRSGLKRVGVLDFQDAVLGPPAYDVASLLQDARVTVPPDLELKLLGLYAGARRRVDPGFDVAAFASAYAIMGAQRATKILGIFARLDRRDGKPQYLAHLPRIHAYLARNLAHSSLERVRGWFVANLPDEFGRPSDVPAADAEEPPAGNGPFPEGDGA